MFTKATAAAPRVALVGCSALKSPTPAAAREFYTSPLFRAAYAYAEKTADLVFVVSALYGAVTPEQVLKPYDRSLRGLRKSEREDWGARTVAEVLGSARVRRFGEKPVLVLLAGEVYADALLHGAHWHNLPRPEEPLRKIAGVGKRIAWLRAHTPAEGAPLRPVEAMAAGKEAKAGERRRRLGSVAGWGSRRMDLARRGFARNVREDQDRVERKRRREAVKEAGAVARSVVANINQQIREASAQCKAAAIEARTGRLDAKTRANAALAEAAKDCATRKADALHPGDARKDCARFRRLARAQANAINAAAIENSRFVSGLCASSKATVRRDGEKKIAEALKQLADAEEYWRLVRPKKKARGTPAPRRARSSSGERLAEWREQQVGNIPAQWRGYCASRWPELVRRSKASGGRIEPWEACAELVGGDDPTVEFREWQASQMTDEAAEKKYAQALAEQEREYYANLDKEPPPKSEKRPSFRARTKPKESTAKASTPKASAKTSKASMPKRSAKASAPKASKDKGPLRINQAQGIPAQDLPLELRERAEVLAQDLDVGDAYFVTFDGEGPSGAHVLHEPGMGQAWVRLDHPGASAVLLDSAKKRSANTAAEVALRYATERQNAKAAGSKPRAGRRAAKATAAGAEEIPF